jgi:hypothetical protein
MAGLICTVPDVKYDIRPTISKEELKDALSRHGAIGGSLLKQAIMRKVLAKHHMINTANDVMLGVRCAVQVGDDAEVYEKIGGQPKLLGKYVWRPY